MVNVRVSSTTKHAARVVLGVAQPEETLAWLASATIEFCDPKVSYTF